MRVISRKGMAAATMQEIADEAGVAKGTIYLYFRDRDELVEKTFEAATTKLMERIDAALEADRPIEEKMRAIMAAHLTFFTENREFLRLYMSLRTPEGPAAARPRKQQLACRPQYRTRVEKFARALEAAMERGEIVRRDAYKVALFIIEGSTAIILERLNEERPPEEAVDLDLITGLILDGIRKRS